MAFASQPTQGLPLVCALMLVWTGAWADEFADVDPERLARGVEILAMKWTIPIVVFHGATDDFAEIEDDDGTSTGVLRPMHPDTLDHIWYPCAYQNDDARLPNLLQFGIAPECVLGPANRRRD